MQKTPVALAGPQAGRGSSFGHCKEIRFLPVHSTGTLREIRCVFVYSPVNCMGGRSSHPRPSYSCVRPGLASTQAQKNCRREAQNPVASRLEGAERKSVGCSCWRRSGLNLSSGNGLSQHTSNVLSQCTTLGRLLTAHLTTPCADGEARSLTSPRTHP